MSIAIISDNADELEELIALATRGGFEGVNGFAHPAIALDWCMENIPDLVLVDFLMRASDGLEVIRHLRATPGLAEVPLVLMLPHGFQSVSAAAIHNGATDFLAKPVDPAEFFARTRNLLELRAARMRADVSDEAIGRWSTARLGAGALSRVH